MSGRDTCTPTGTEGAVSRKRLCIGVISFHPWCIVAPASLTVTKKLSTRKQHSYLTLHDSSRLSPGLLLAGRHALKFRLPFARVCSVDLAKAKSVTDDCWGVTAQVCLSTLEFGL